LPAPFHHKQREVGLGALSRADAVELVCEVLRQEGRAPKHDDAGNTPQEITDLVEAVNRHARALTLLAREISRGGVRATTENLRQLMAELHRRHPNDRENSLYASVELSLRRLPLAWREQVRVLGVFQGGVHLGVLQMMLNTDEETISQLAFALIGIGLAKDVECGHLSIDPALPSYMLCELNTPNQIEALEAMKARWAEAMIALVATLEKLRHQNTEVAARLTLLELANLMSLLKWMQSNAKPDVVTILASSLESLLADLGRKQSLAQITLVREQVASELKEWGRARFTAQMERIERLLEQAAFSDAQTAAEQFVRQALSAGGKAYDGADYDIAMAHFLLGRVLEISGKAEAALEQLAEAQRRFLVIANSRDTDAEQMTLCVYAEIADCLMDLWRWDEAMAIYQECVGHYLSHGNLRGAAVCKGKIGKAYFYQGHFADALTINQEMLSIFTDLQEPGSMAIAWEEIGKVYKETKRLDQAERAYRQALALNVQQNHLSGEASCLNELGKLYEEMGRLDEAVSFFQQAIDSFIKLQDQRYEGFVRQNMALALIQLQRYDKARNELRRVIECNGPYGNAVQPWLVWNILYDLEKATNNFQSAAYARRQAIALYLAYRRGGGQCNTSGAWPIVVAQTLLLGTQDQVTTLFVALDETLHAAADDSATQALIPKLQAILRGEHSLEMVEDEALNYDDAAELQLLLEALSGK
jgi:tetratricopeptide (TPR) repeat protein